MLFIFGCSKKSDKEYYDLGADNLKKENITEAVKNFELVVQKYPESPFSSTALYNLATIYQGGRIKTLNEQQSLEKAVSYYKQVYENYPKSKEAPTSLFMTGFIQANDLLKYDEATESYKKFLRDYPNHELAKQAQLELDNMRLSPDEILRRRSANK
jgi:TolA-binding protein